MSFHYQGYPIALHTYKVYPYLELAKKFFLKKGVLDLKYALFNNVKVKISRVITHFNINILPIIKEMAVCWNSLST